MSVRGLLAASLCSAGLVLTAAQAGAAGTGSACGGIARPVCDRGLWCEPQPGQCRRRTGICIRPPEVCTMIYQPVCGCDGKIYGNDCERRGHRVGKAHDGGC